jgi:hypothetical protein
MLTLYMCRRESELSWMGGARVRRFSLVKTSIERENQWLLIKGNDEFASDEDLTISRPESVLTKMTNNELVLESESNKKQQKKKSKTKDKMTTRAARISSIHLESKGSSKRKNKSDIELSDIPVLGFPTENLAYVCKSTLFRLAFSLISIRLMGLYIR